MEGRLPLRVSEAHISIEMQNSIDRIYEVTPINNHAAASTLKEDCSKRFQVHTCWLLNMGINHMFLFLCF